MHLSNTCAFRHYVTFLGRKVTAPTKSEGSHTPMHERDKCNLSELALLTLSNVLVKKTIIVNISSQKQQLSRYNYMSNNGVKLKLSLAYLLLYLLLFELTHNGTIAGKLNLGTNNNPRCQPKGGLR